MEPAVSIRNLVNAFGRQRLHDQLNLDVMPGEILGIVGGSGTGKSVLMRSMLGLRKPQAGEGEGPAQKQPPGDGGALCASQNGVRCHVRPRPVKRASQDGMAAAALSSRTNRLGEM